MSEAFNAERLTRLCDFLQQSPTPWHATRSMAQRLEQGGLYAPGRDCELAAFARKALLRDA